MENNIKELILKIEKLIDLLDEFEDDGFWSKKFKESLRRIENRDFSGIELILSFYGGMGSFNDLIISRYNHYNITKKDEETVNEELEKLRSDIFTLATNIKRNFLR